METALNQIKQLAIGVDRTAREAIIAALNQAAYSLENPDDTIHRLGYLHLQTAAVKTGFDLELFTYFTEAGGPVTVEKIASNTGAEIAFLKRFLSYLASVGIIKETGKDTFEANNVTRNLAEKVSEAGISHCFATIGPQFQTVPSFLKRTSYRNPTNETDTVFQEAWNTSSHAFAWFSDRPENLRYFNDYMAFRREPETSWLTVYPVEDTTKGWSADQPVYVNMGGGIGHQCAQFKNKHPEVAGRVILQDLPHSIAKALPTPGVENLEHNFFEPQPIKGAKFYFLRGVLHNHPDHKVRQILENIKSAMTPESIILLDEMVLPETGVSSYAAAMDLTMMAAFASMERSEAQWRKILEDVGLVLTKTYTYNSASYEAVMDVRLP